MNTSANLRCTCFDSSTAGRPWCPIHDMSAGAPGMPDDVEFVFDPGVQLYPMSFEPMSLRDYFAGQALAGITVNPNAEALADTMGEHGYADIPEVLSAIAYGIADRMLAERERDS